MLLSSRTTGTWCVVAPRLAEVISVRTCRSLNGTFVNDKRIPKNTDTEITDGVEVCFSKDRNTTKRA